MAFYTDRVTLDLNAVVRNEVNMYTSRGEGGNNVKRAIALAAAGKLKGKELVTHRFPLEAISEGLRVLRERIGDRSSCRDETRYHNAAIEGLSEDFDTLAGREAF